MLDARLGFSLWALRLAFGASSIVSGLANFNTLATSTRVAGVVELVAGVLIFTPLTELAATFLTGWLLFLALRAAVPGGEWVLALCDVMLAAGAFALARFTRVNEAAAAREQFRGTNQGTTRSTRGKRSERARMTRK